MTVLLAIPGGETPALTDFQTDNSALAPRSLDLLNFYQGWTGNPVWWGSYPTWAAELGAQMFISWAPASGSLYGGGGTSNGTLGNVTTGNADTYLNTAASTIATYGQTVYIRLAYEFNGNWNSYGNGNETAAQFVAGWQYIVNKVRTGGGTNAKWIWSPNIWGQGDSNIIDPCSSWYPGDSYVDIVALDGYMTQEDPSVLTPSDLFLDNYQELSSMTTKSFAFGEVGCAEDTRLISIGGKAGWFNLLFQLIQNDMPNCVMMDYYNRDAPPDSPDDDFTISSSGSDTAAAAAFVQGVTSYPFVYNGGRSRLGMFHLGGM